MGAKKRAKKTVKKAKKTRRVAAKDYTDNPIVQSFAKMALDSRKKSGLPLKAVASDLDVSISVVSQWERGQRYPSVDNLVQVLDYYGYACRLVKRRG